jgi:hypothetical protein
MAVEIRGNMAFRQTAIDKAPEEGVKGIVEYRSPLAGEDMPRKPLDTLGGRSHSGPVGGVGWFNPTHCLTASAGSGAEPQGSESAILAAIFPRICTAANTVQNPAVGWIRGQKRIRLGQAYTLYIAPTHHRAAHCDSTTATGSLALTKDRPANSRWSRESSGVSHGSDQSAAATAALPACAIACSHRLTARTIAPHRLTPPDSDSAAESAGCLPASPRRAWTGRRRCLPSAAPSRSPR